MPRPFQRLNLGEFEDLLTRFPFTRKITAVHLHHTWRPRQADFNGLATIEGMWRHHTQVNGWSDIAQHLTIDPEGGTWTGRSWNRSPASASGFNGVASHGPFMIEMIGDFDEGRETLTIAQKEAVLGVLALLHRRHDLRPETLRFHRQMSGKTCPGTGIDQDALILELSAAMEQFATPRRAPGRRSLPFAEDMLESAQKTESVIRTLLAGDDLPEDPPSAELSETGVAGLGSPDGGLSDGSRGGGLDLTPEILDALRPHVINLRQGEFSQGGHFETSPEDVEALVHEHLATWQQEHGDLQLMLYAHGGLVSEKKALTYAYQSLDFWKDNGVYPVYFVWETGLGEIIRQLLGLSERRIRGRRDIWDFTTDLVLENLIRVPSIPVWAGMKRSAEKAAASDGGGLFFVDELRKYISGLDQATKGKVGLHAVGHSAGAIFHSHLLPQLVRANGKRVQSLHFLAPAVTVDLFKENLLPLIGKRKKIRHLSTFTMRKSFERKDNVAFVYRKSLLYLIHRVVEPRRKTPILGLEKSIRRDRDLVELFGLAGQTSDRAEVIWSKTDPDSGRSASRSTKHDGFDNDPATMNSVVRRILDKDDVSPIKDFADYPAGSEGARSLIPETLEDLLEPEALALFDLDAEPTLAATSILVPPPAPIAPVPITQPTREAGAPGLRRALCVGIDAYPTAPLQGCVNDSRTWADVLTSLGFQVTSMTNSQATRDGILQALTNLIASSRAGDVLVFQYAGHGTQLPDVDGDELDGQDESFVPIDYMSGAYLLDDDLGKVFDTIPAGVNVTNFIDCCHSGTLNRMLPGDSVREALHAGPDRMRFLPVDRNMVDAHKSFRRARGLPAPGSRGVNREVHFAACQDTQSAWESEGKGDFTTAAAPLLRQAASGGWTHDQLEEAFEAAFAGSKRQMPNLECDSQRLGEVLFSTDAGPTAATTPSGNIGEVRALLERAVKILEVRQT